MLPFDNTESIIHISLSKYGTDKLMMMRILLEQDLTFTLKKMSGKCVNTISINLSGFHCDSCTEETCKKYYVAIYKFP